ncbi:suppressor of cytokine signaling 2-like isoform X1 [Ostrinia nubilalis]|uniref:suppressor of cytokine signaling 2-like isoform X1 n=1 Tax=Ostrinia nubilalis TaxID=29057 RepID=UPI00308229B1
MCVIERTNSRINSLNMTLAARLHVPNACVEVGVPIGSWSGACPNCRHELRVSLAACPGKRQAPPTPQMHVASPFLFPPTYFTPYCTPLPPYDDSLRARLGDTYKALRLSGWYYGNLDWQGARSLLKEASIGAFLLRNSGDSNFIFSLSVQTDRGPTSVRLHFEQGFFRLDCDLVLAKYMPRFRCVVELVQHYTRAGERSSGAGTMWVDRDGCPHSPVLLTSPLRSSPPTLLHAARLALHKALDSNPLQPKLWCAPKHRLLPLPSALIDYLGEYPYSI